MIEIGKTVPGKDDRGRIRKKGKSAGTGSTDTSFKTELKQAVAFDVQGTMDELLGELGDQERRFMDQQTPYEMNRYKAMVQKILKMVLDESIETQTIRRRRRDNRADWNVAEIINEKIHAISEAITRRNTAFNLLKTMEEIRGLILDLMH